MRGELRPRAEEFLKRYGRRMTLAVVLVGDDPASKIYVENKRRACEEVGIRSLNYFLPAETSEGEVCSLLDTLAEDSRVHGILLQLPLPAPLEAERILAHIPTEKDVDGFSAENIGNLIQRLPCLAPCTPSGIMELLKRNGICVRGKRAVVVGRSNIVGRPMAALLLNADATVTVCHSKTVNLREECVRADLLIAAVGKARLIGADMVKEGAVVVDVGMNRVNGKLCGDVDFEAVREKASYLTPVPGGVGPMTIAMLMKNTCDAAERSVRNELFRKIQPISARI